MDYMPTSLSQAADDYAKWPLFPALDIAHYILMVLVTREDIGHTSSFPKSNPLVCYLCSMLTCFAGGILANFLLGAPVMQPFANTQGVIAATIVWYLVFYSPGDFFYKLIVSTPGKLVVISLKELARARKISMGIKQSHALYPDAIFIMIMVGAAKANGSSLMKNFERLLRGTWNPSTNELILPSFTLKASIIGSSLLVLQHQGYIPIDYNILMMCISLSTMSFKIAVLFFDVHDPFNIIEDYTKPTVFGKNEVPKKVKKSKGE
ncbi:trimeric intracellular cation channel type 1B.1-like [Anneissia japonica]|uniref:trimeric intracellular cation channel type 1B.1-like n=1 Tax=Anneissia japonica TaxID=1529436 RepID=UPI001425B01A|nr:trimeric intracellular cation channel type 1B.1-like [Anneissia japonica]